MSDSFAILHNPSRWVNKYEVWVYGPVSEFNTHGGYVTKNIARCFNAFPTEKRAEAEIQYQVDVMKFRAGSGRHSR